MKKTLTLGPGLELPLAAVTSTFGLLAVRGAGKSNTAAVMAEEMFDAGLPFVVIDPVGSWFGLRSGADGQKGGGLPVPIFGGKHGDLPLDRGAGELLADLVAEKRLSCVLDLSGFDSEGDKKAFLLAFARRLYLKNENPLHLFLEEADDYIPQKPLRDEALLLRAWENIVRRGRARGLGMTLITQRSAAVNKMVLTQVETLFAMRTTGPQDIAAIEAWIRYHQVGHEVLKSLASLQDGEAWVWSPGFLRTMQRVQVRRRRTFDSGATPKNMRSVDAKKPATLADVDLAALEVQLSATIERAKADDPQELRRRIAALERELAAAKAAAPAVERVEVPAIDDAHREWLDGLVAAIGQSAEKLHEAKADILATLAKASTVGTVRVAPSAGIAAPTRPVVSAASVPAARPRRAAADESGDLDESARRILDVAHELERRGIPRTRESIARWLDIHPNGGRYGSNLALLRAQGLLDGYEVTNAAFVRALPRGLDGAKAPLDGAQRSLVDVLDLNRGKRFSRETLAKVLGIHPNGGRFGSNLARLRTMGLIPERGDIYLLDAAYA